jgi:transposase InsO family protein
MPWKELKIMDQREQFVLDYLTGDYPKGALCAVYGISRPTGDKWLARYHAHGVAGLADLARRPHTQPHRTPDALVAAIVAMKHRHPSFGPKKIRDRLRAVAPTEAWPVDSTVGVLLKHAGLVRPRWRRRRVPADPQALQGCTGAAQSWSADFKGDFPLGNGQRCYPLTLTDNYSRYLLHCQGLLHPTTAAVQPWFVWVFREYGLPETMRTDNGPPFASTALGGLSRLAAWWVRLGIRPQRIRPGTPSENGRHERMHRALKAAVGRPAATLAAQQRRFAAFVQEYNWARSHEALARCTPGSVHQRSPRPYPVKLPPIDYAPGTLVRQVRHNGEVKWRGHMLYLSEVLAQEPVGFTPIGESTWAVHYSFHLLGTLDERTLTITSARQWHQPDDPQAM